MTHPDADLSSVETPAGSREDHGAPAEHGNHPSETQYEAPPGVADAAGVGAEAGSVRHGDPTPKPTATTPLDDLQGRMLGEFKLVRRLGAGGMAEVYLAEQPSLGRHVAVKVLRGETLGDEVLLKRFEQEARAAGGLNHPSIVQVYSIGEQEGVHYIAQEYVDGLNLREYLVEHGPPDVATALSLMRQVASALEAADEAGIVHRDVKPENILITKKGHAKVADFGLAQLTLAGERVNLTQVGVTMGTPLYMSPEQLGGKAVDRRSDIYSLGVTCYQMLSGQPPFRGETAISVAVQHLNREAPPLEEVRRDLPRVVCRLVHRMMSKDPESRYPDAASLLADIDRIIHTLQERPEALGRLKLSKLIGAPPQGRLGRLTWWAFRHPAASFLAAAVIVASASASVGLWARPPSPLSAPLPAGRRIPKWPTAKEQYANAAILVSSKEAWNAVIRYYPETYEAHCAKAELAWLYLHDDDYEEARKLYTELTGEEFNLRLKAQSYAGLMIIASVEGRHDDALEIYTKELQPLWDHLSDDEAMQELISEARKHSEKELKEDLREKSKELFPSENGDPSAGQ